jgi:hypothetical protein
MRRNRTSWQKCNNLFRLLHFCEGNEGCAFINNRKLVLDARFYVACCGQNTPPLPPQLRTALPGREKVFTSRLAPAMTPELTALQICRL